MKRSLGRTLAILFASLVLGISGAYASFTSNVVNIQGTSITTGQAVLKLCDKAIRVWRNTLTPNISLADMNPEEERDIFSERELWVGNDGGKLHSGIEQGTSPCFTYAEGFGHSTTPLRLVPNVVIASETCPDPLPSNIKLRFELNGQDTGAKTLNAWNTNTTQFDPVITANQRITLKAYAQLSSTTTSQNGNCAFTINFTGKQPTT